MFANREKALLQTFRSVTGDPDFYEWEDHKSDLLHVEANFGAGRRELTIDNLAKHSIAIMNDEQRGEVVRKLLAMSKHWPEGAAQIRCLGDYLITPQFTSETYFRYS